MTSNTIPEFLAEHAIIQELLAEHILSKAIMEFETPERYGFKTCVEMFDFIQSENPDLSDDFFDDITLYQDVIDIMERDNINLADVLKDWHRFDSLLVANVYLALNSVKEEFVSIEG